MSGEGELISPGAPARTPHPNRPTYESAHNPADQLNTPPPLRYAKGTRRRGGFETRPRTQGMLEIQRSTQTTHHTIIPIISNHSHHSSKPPLRSAKGTRAKHAGDARKSQPLRHSRTHQRHSRRRGNPEKTNHAVSPVQNLPRKLLEYFPPHALQAPFWCYTCATRCTRNEHGIKRLTLRNI